MGAYEFGSSLFPGDLNEDAMVDELDLFLGQPHWYDETSFAPLPGDQNGDNRFDGRDLIILEHAWGNETSFAPLPLALSQNPEGRLTPAKLRSP
jgi:hypothetical protein